MNAGRWFEENREPPSTHLRLLEKCGFAVRAELKTRRPSGAQS